MDNDLARNLAEGIYASGFDAQSYKQVLLSWVSKASKEISEKGNKYLEMSDEDLTEWVLSEVTVYVGNTLTEEEATLLSDNYNLIVKLMGGIVEADLLIKAKILNEYEK